MQAQIVFSGGDTTTGADSKVYGNISSGGSSTIAANSRVFGNIVSVSTAMIGAAGTVSGNIVSGGVLAAGAGSVIGGDITSGGASTVGAGTQVGGNIVSGGAATTGASSDVHGNVATAGAASIGAAASVDGIVSAVGTISILAGATVGGQQQLVSPPIDATVLAAALAADAQATAYRIAAARSALTNLGAGTVLSATIASDMTLYSGVYTAAGLSTGAGTILTLDGQGLANQFWVFNIMDGLTAGASSVIRMINFGANNTVTWNSDGYVSIGAGAEFLGNIFAQGYVNVGAGAMVSGAGGRCGGIYSQTADVSFGAGSTMGSAGCKDPVLLSGPVLLPDSGDVVVPEPTTLAVLAMALFLTFVASRSNWRAAPTYA